MRRIGEAGGGGASLTVRAHSGLAFVVSQKKKAIMDDGHRRAANCCGDCWALNAVFVVDEIVASSAELENVIVGSPWTVLPPLFRHGIDDASACLSELRFVSGTGDLEFLDNISLNWKRNTGARFAAAKNACCVAAVHRVIVEVPALPLKPDHAEIPSV